jgi:ribosomal protein S12 methylthiotransferase accessory factor
MTSHVPVLRESIDRILDDRFGVIRLLVEDPREAGAPDFFHYYAEACNTRAFGFEPNFSSGGGAATERDGAMMKALGEAIERYCAAMYTVSDLPFTSRAAAPFACVDPSDFALYRADQCAAGNIEFVPFTDDVPVRWTQAVDVESSEEVYVPAAMVYVPYMYDVSAGELPIVQPISTGLACNEGFEAACVSAACEAIERDAFTILWQAALSPPRVNPQSLDSSNANRLDRFTRARYDVTIFDVTTDIAVPTVVAAARHDDESQPAFVIAAATHPQPQVAIRKCLEELEHTRSWARALKAAKAAGETPCEPANIVTQRDHLCFWNERANRARADWLFASKAMRDAEALGGTAATTPMEQLRFVRDALRAAGLRLLIVDVTTPDIAELDLRVVRAVIPGLHPLVIGHAKRVLTSVRLRDVPIRLGYEQSPLAEDEANRPHPFR